MDRNVRLLDGTTVRIVCDDGERAEMINSIMIEPFIDDIMEGWLATGARSLPAENRIKGYLTYVGYLLIEKPDSYGVLSMNKIRNIKNHELENEDLDNPCTATAIAEKNKKSARQITRFEKLQNIAWSEGTEPVCLRVDTDGCFDYNGIEFMVVDIKYAGIKAKGWDCPYYQFDRIWVLDSIVNCGFRFYDQNLDRIPNDHICVRIKDGDGGEEIWQSANHDI